VVVILAFGLSVAALAHGYARTTSSLRSAWGLNVLLASVVVGLAPSISTAVAMIAPQVVLPGSEYYDLVWVPIPFALARAAILHASATAPGQASSR
jgi:Ni/Fe-hydrogenase subunit HybB-like protein